MKENISHLKNKEKSPLFPLSSHSQLNVLSKLSKVGGFYFLTFIQPLAHCIVAHNLTLELSRIQSFSPITYMAPNLRTISDLILPRIAVNRPTIHPDTKSRILSTIFCFSLSSRPTVNKSPDPKSISPECPATNQFKPS